MHPRVTGMHNKLDVDPSKGQRCIPDVVLKNERSTVQICRNMNVHVVNTDICWDLQECL